MPIENFIETDVLVIGGGMSGLFAAIKAREEGVEVILVDKGYVSRSGATCFSDCYHAVFNPDWGHNLEDWKEQISISGEYMNNPDWTEITLKESYDRFKELTSWGVVVQKDKDGNALKMHMRNTVSEAIWLGRGWTITPLIRKQAVKSGVKIMDRIMITDLIEQDARVIGAVGFHTRSGDWYVFKSKATVLSAGSGSFKPVAPSILSNHSFDGESIAYRAGAEISGKEFSTAAALTYHSKREDGAWRSIEGKKVNTFLTDNPSWAFFYTPLIYMGNVVDSEGYDLAGLFAGATAAHEGRAPFFVNTTGANREVIEYALGMAQGDNYRFERLGVDPRERALWSGTMRFEGYIGLNWGGGGGIASVDTQGATSLPGLYAAGDNYHSGAIGASYPHGGTGTRNAAVTGARAGLSAAKFAQNAEESKLDLAGVNSLKNITYAPLERKGGFDTVWVTQQLQNIMFPYYVWIIKHGDRLKAALTMVDFLSNHIAPKIYAKDAHTLCLVHETKNRILNAEMMLRSALFRTESRGKTYREDYPRRDDDNWLAWVKIRKGDDQMILSKSPLPEKWWPDISRPYKDRYPMRFMGEE